MGGEVADEGATKYTDTNIIEDGMSHHTALETIDNSLSGVATATTNNTLQNESTLLKLTNTADKLDPSATLAAPFTYANTNLIIQEERIKSIVEKFDRYIDGTRRNAEFAFKTSHNALVRTYINEGLNILATQYDTFFDSTKLDVLTTASVSNDTQYASGDGEYVVYKESSIGTTITYILLDWEVSGTGSIEVRFHCNNETTWSNMEIFNPANKGLFQLTTIQDENLAVR